MILTAEFRRANFDWKTGEADHVSELVHADVETMNSAGVFYVVLLNSVSVPKKGTQSSNFFSLR